MAKDRERPRPPRTWTKLVLLALAASLAIWLAGCGGDAPADDAGPLRLGLLVNLSAGAPARAVERQRAFELAVQHVNAAGGVFGQPVQFVVGDSTLDPEKAVAVARRLVEEEGVHAIVGPTSSANALAVAERVTGPAAYPPSAPRPRRPLWRSSTTETSSSAPPCRMALRGRCWRGSPANRVLTMWACCTATTPMAWACSSPLGRHGREPLPLWPSRAGRHRTCPSSAGPRRAGRPRWWRSPSRARGRSSCERPSTAAFTPALPLATPSRARTWYKPSGATGWAACTAPPAHPTPTTPPPPRGTRPTPPSTARRPPSPTHGRPTTRQSRWP